jgi:lipopolysaccharide transport system ATP-binding protein
MSDIAIRVENLSKAYRIGLKEQQHETMLGAMAAWVKSPFRNFREVRNLSRFDDARVDREPQTTDHGPQDSKSVVSGQLSVVSSEAPPSDIIWALNDVSFEVKHGEAVGIIGRNGAGKSTLLKILSRITEPTSGRATIYGRVGSLLEVGTGFHPDLTGRENIYLNGTILGMKKREIDGKFDEIVDFSGVEKFIDTPVKRYSSGMRVRLAFSVAAHLEPEILVIDEVLAVGDAEFQIKCLGKMGEVARRGRTVLFVSHNLLAIEQLCTSALLLNQGQTACFSATEATLAEYNRILKQTCEGQSQAPRGTSDGAVRILHCEVLNKDAQRYPLPGPFEDVILRLHLDVAQPIKRPGYGVEIRSLSGIVMLSVNSVELGVVMPPLAIGGTHIDIKVKDIRYVPGKYLASVWVMGTPKPVHARLDELGLQIRQKPICGTREMDERFGCVVSALEFSMTDRLPASDPCAKR